ncbi:DUF805 domain-containing protein [Roseicyclus persicicus]|uniref:DUF805 domain-containing protein n=1 Tax=Roseicyclus persicicus TaxID=2650661 RepID=A0A7X6JXJ4_9RHOB|nr:DUF805 domain-containing protein [Roseibacterium persicicum]NKX45597.1 DUF805 domain-containing protein [Roseibacterium persicicum]
MGPIRAIGSCYRNMLNFSGRARRAEYWWFALFLTLVGVGLQVGLGAYLAGDPALMFRLDDPAAFKDLAAVDADVLPYVGAAVLAAFVLGWLPQLSVTVRRLHDTDRSGWFIFMPLVVSVGAVVAALFLGVAGAGASAALPILLMLAVVPLLANLWFLVVLCLPGTAGDNRFGPDPVPGRRRREPDHPAFATRLEPADQAAVAAQRKAEIRDYYRKHVLPSIQKA